MPSSAPSTGSDPAARGSGVWVLAVGQTLGYASLYYIFAALIQTWRGVLDWPIALISAGPTLAILLSASLAPLTGRLVDLGHGRALMTGGALVGAAGLALIAVAPGPILYLGGWAVIGLAQAATLYEVCFAVLIRRFGDDARAAIVRVTLLAGFASTLAFPAGAALAEALGWRGAVWAAAACAIGLVAPVNWWATGRIGAPAHRPPGTPGGARHVLRRAAFWRLAGALGAVSLNHWMLVQFAVPIFVAQGQTGPGAVLAASVIGPAQVAGRLAILGLEARIGTLTGALITVAMMIGATGLLLAAGLAPVLVFAFAALQGAAIGIMTIFRPSLIRDALGEADYGAVAGMAQVPALTAGAAAPVLGGLLLEGPGLGAILALSLALSLATLGLIARLRRGG